MTRTLLIASIEDADSLLCTSIHEELLVADSKGKSNTINLTTVASESCFRLGLHKCAEINIDPAGFVSKMVRFCDHTQHA